MERVLERCAGLDVHKKTVTACVRVPGDHGDRAQHVRTFGTTTAELLTLRDWLEAHHVTHVAMESTGVYWRPVFNLLEAHHAVVLVNPRHMRAVPGRKTEVKLRHDVASIAVEQEQSRLDLVYCHQSPTRPCEQSNPLV